jgi:hypothetical protein
MPPSIRFARPPAAKLIEDSMRGFNVSRIGAVAMQISRGMRSSADLSTVHVQCTYALTYARRSTKRQTKVRRDEKSSELQRQFWARNETAG